MRVPPKQPVNSNPGQASHPARTALCALCVLCALTLPASASAKRLALLIGVGHYADSTIPSLAGPPNDVAALRDVLLRRWGFGAQDVLTLVDAQASRANIARELAALAKRSEQGDEIVVYFSGHGTSAYNSSAQLAVPVPHGSGAFVPVDFIPGKSGSAGLIVGRWDLVPVFKKLEEGGRRLWVIADTCYSGQAVRSIGTDKADKLPERMIPMHASALDKLEQRADLALAEQAGRHAAYPAYPYRSTLFLAAAAEGERAVEIPASMLSRIPTFDGKAHGAMSDALLRVLEGSIPGDLNGDGVLSLDEVQRAIAEFMDGRAYGHTPLRLPAVAEDQYGLGSQPVLSMRNIAAKPNQTASQPGQHGQSGQPAQPIRLLRVALENLPADLTQAIAAVPDVALINQINQIKQIKPGEAADIVLRIRDQQLGILAASGDLLASMPPGDILRATAQIRQLAWARRIRALAEQHRRGALPTEIDPAQYGGNFTIGKTISFVVRPDQSAVIVLININADGKVSVLYPASQAETKAQAGGQALYIPGKEERLRIKVQEPFGMDVQMHFAFDAAPPGLAQIIGLDSVDPDDARLRGFINGIAAMAGKFSFAHTTLRTLK